MELLIKFPTRSRPIKFIDTYLKYIDYLAYPTKTRFIINIDENDKTMNNITMLNNITKAYDKTTIHIANNHSKIEAINANITNERFDILLLASDDMIPIKHGYDDIIRYHMNNYYSDLDGVLWFNDGFKHHTMNTIVCCGYNYFKRFNYIYAPCYKSFNCDLEFQTIAELLNKQTYIDHVIIEHQHYLWTNESPDTLYQTNQKFALHDRKQYYKRKTKWKRYMGINSSYIII